MREEWLIKILALCVVVLFVSVSFQPIIAENITLAGKESDYSNVNFEEAKTYLFQTVIEMANNPEVKELFEQLKYNYRLFTSDYDYKSVVSQIYLKKPDLLLGILFNKPSITYEYLNKIYNSGIKCVNIIGEKQALEMTDSIKISNPDLMIELNNIIKNDKELSNRISTLEIMNNNLKLDSPLMSHPIMCAVMILICIPTFILLLFFTMLLSIFMNNEDLIQIYPKLFGWAAKNFLVMILLMAVFFETAGELCIY